MKRNTSPPLSVLLRVRTAAEVHAQGCTLSSRYAQTTTPEHIHCLEAPNSTDAQNMMRGLTRFSVMVPLDQLLLGRQSKTYHAMPCLALPCHAMSRAISCARGRTANIRACLASHNHVTHVARLNDMTAYRTPGHGYVPARWAEYIGKPHRDVST